MFAILYTTVQKFGDQFFFFFGGGGGCFGNKLILVFIKAASNQKVTIQIFIILQSFLF